MTTDPREIISRSRMGWLQIVIIAITVGLNSLDGFDVESISFAAPGIANEWHLDNTALGIVLSMELIGMAIGSIFIGNVADRIGRRRTMLGCLVLMAFGMFMVTTSTTLETLSIWRVLSGLGIGGMLAAVNAVTAEFSNSKRRNFNVAIMAIGYPLGAILGGMLVAHLLIAHGWRSIFYLGAVYTAIYIPLVLIFVPESVHWLARKQPSGALERINRALRRMGHAAVTALPALVADARKHRVTELFTPGLIAVTVLVTIAYFFHIMTFYFILKWVPKLVVNMGFTPSSASTVLVWTNVGGATGGLVLGLLSLKWSLKPLTIVMMVLSAIMVAAFGRSPHHLESLSLICAGAGFCTNAAICGMYAIFAQAFPTHSRAGGTGFAIGVGRGGAVLAPIIAGFLFDQGVSVATVAAYMGLGSLIAAGVLLALKVRPGAEEDAGVAASTAAAGVE
ncbi:MAG: MFS transporter [Steroidobacteraceae bacterium]